MSWPTATLSMCTVPPDAFLRKEPAGPGPGAGGRAARPGLTLTAPVNYNKKVMLDEKELARLARLGGLRLDSAETARLVRDLGQMLEYVGLLQAVPTDDVPPAGGCPEGGAGLREDRVRESLTVPEALSGAPDRSGDYFRVPAVVVARRKGSGQCPGS